MLFGALLLGCATPSPPPPGVTVSEITVGDAELTVWVADTPEERSQGLMGVERLPSTIDGMLFVFEEPSSRSFHMLGTPMPLDIWWFGPDLLVGVTEMMPCPAEPCPDYPSPGPVAFALETPSGSLELAIGDPLSTVENG